MQFYAHTKEGSEEEWQTIREHAENVARLCVEFSERWCTREYAENLGLLHDVGKYQADFQERLRDPSVHIEHAFCGAIACKKYAMTFAEYCIAGHHAGLPDCGTPDARMDENTLFGKMKRKAQDFSAYMNELSMKKIDRLPIKFPVSSEPRLAQKQIAFWLRMVFSSLVDADYLDTERYVTGKERKPVRADFSVLLQKLKERYARFPSESEVQKARSSLLLQLLSYKQEDAELYCMNMPTGSGKTLASMRFALEQAVRLGLKRIIYVIPYTSIIEQNAQVFREIFGEDIVLEHHCNFDYDAFDEEDTAKKFMHAAENWDAPIVVTTNVQFFQSIYNNKPSQMRKLHNIADSMLVFDEVHMFPSLFYQPCLEAVKTLVKEYGCRALFLSATMPDFENWLHTFDCDGLRMLDLIPDKQLFSVFDRCKIQDLAEVDTDALICKAEEGVATLIVVNTKKAAKALYEKIPGKKYHLSTYMTKYDRTRVIEEVKRCLREGERFILVSTSLIEAGVDLDFAAVFRERAGLDNILQAAGRCNREGMRSAEASVTYVFDFADEELCTKDQPMCVKQYLCREAMNDHGTSLQAVKAYFDKLFRYNTEEMRENDFANFITRFGFQFESYAEKFHLIDDNTENLVIEYPGEEEEQELLAALPFGGRQIKRRLQKYTVSVRPREFAKLMEQGVVVQRGGFNVLVNFSYYDRETGIRFSDDSNYIF